jgi:hypothetical protein
MTLAEQPSLANERARRAIASSTATYHPRRSSSIRRCYSTPTRTVASM